jgi:hypothetical protein
MLRSQAQVRTAMIMQPYTVCILLAVLTVVASYVLALSPSDLKLQWLLYELDLLQFKQRGHLLRA